MIFRGIVAELRGLKEATDALRTTVEEQSRKHRKAVRASGDVGDLRTALAEMQGKVRGVVADAEALIVKAESRFKSARNVEDRVTAKLSAGEDPEEPVEELSQEQIDDIVLQQLSEEGEVDGGGNGLPDGEDPVDAAARRASFGI